MRKAVAMLGLVLMAVGIMLTAFGTQQTVVHSQPIWQWQCPPTGDICIGGPIYLGGSTQPSFTLNYVGMSIAVMGSVFFATLYQKRPSSSLPANAISLSL
jgi:uncharacterized membrane protein